MRCGLVGEYVTQQTGGAAVGGGRDEGAELSPDAGGEDAQTPRLVVGDDEVIGRRHVADAAWSTDHVATKNTNQLRAVLQSNSTQLLVLPA